MTILLAWLYVGLLVVAYCGFAIIIAASVYGESEGWRRCKDCGIFYYSTGLYPPQHELPRTGRRIPFGVCDECQRVRDNEEAKALAAARKPLADGGDAKPQVHRTAAVFFGKN